MPRFNPLNGSVHHVPHGISSADLQPGSTIPPISEVRPGFGLYIGNINDRHDFSIWERLFSELPMVDFLIVGPIKVNDPVGRRLIHERPFDNVRFMDAVPYDQLAGLIAASGFGFLFLKGDHPANRISSQKVIQFLAQGKPFFTSWLSEYADMSAPLMCVAADADEAVSCIKNLLRDGDPPEAAAERISLAKTQLYDNLISGLPFRL